MRAYLEAVRRAGAAIPGQVLAADLGLPPERTPSLLAIFVERYIDEQGHQTQRTPQGPDAPDAAPADPPVRQSLRNALASHRHVLIEGAPGTGKSTLLAHFAHWLAETSLSEESRDILPLRVSARWLIGSVPEATWSAEVLAYKLRQAVLQGTGISLPEDIFSDAGEDTTWIVMVDGVDEIASQSARETLLHQLRQAETDRGLQFRFVVTSRPGFLAHSSDLPASTFARYTLSPFSWNEAFVFIRNWFVTMSGSPGDAPVDQGERFLRELIDSRISDLLLVPQLLGIAIVLFDISGGQRLPAKRAELFAELARLLLSQAPRRGVLEVLKAEWANRMTDGSAYAERFFSRRRAILAHTAVRLQEGSKAPMEEEAVRLARSNGWLPAATVGLDETWLMAAVGLVLRGTGLVNTRAASLEFVDQTFQEFLAVEGLTRGDTPNKHNAVGIVSRWKQEQWRQVVLFFLGQWTDKDAVTAQLRKVRRGWFGTLNRQGLLFAGEALADGVSVSQEEQNEIIERLAAQAMQDHWPLPAQNPTSTLALIGHGELAERRLLEISMFAPDDAVRVTAAEGLGVRGIVRRNPTLLEASLRSLRELTHKPSHLAQMWAVAALDNLRQDDELMRVAEDENVSGLVRVHAADRIAQRGNVERVVKNFVELARGRDSSGAHYAVGKLGEYGRVSELISVYIDDERSQYQIVSVLAGLGPTKEVLGALRDIVRMSSEGSTEAQEAIEKLAGFGATELLQMLTADPGVEGIHRARAAEKLWGLGKREDAWLALTGLVRRTDDFWGQSEATDAIGRVAELDELHALLRDTGLDSRVQDDLAEVIARRFSALAALNVARDVAVPLGARLEAAVLAGLAEYSAEARALIRQILESTKQNPLRHEYSLIDDCVKALERLQAVVDLNSVARDPDLDSFFARKHAVEALARLGQKETARRLAADPHTTPVVRVAAAEALIQLHETDAGVATVRSMVREPATSEFAKLLAATSLARHGWKDELIALREAPSSSDWLREKAAAELAKLQPKS